MVAPVPMTPQVTPPRTVWGLDPVALHTHYWASLGVQIVRQGEPSQIVPHAELYLLTDPRSLPLFSLNQALDVLNWATPQVLFVRIHDTRDRGYRERVITDGSDRFVKFQRVYDSADRLARVVLTPEREIAMLWQKSDSPLNGWRRLRRFVPRSERSTLSIDGQVYDRASNEEQGAFLQQLVRCWHCPNSTISRAKLDKSRTSKRGAAYVQVHADPDSAIDPTARMIGNVWVGAGRHVDANSTIVGPAVLWDEPAARPPMQDIQWLTIEPSGPPPQRDIGTIPPSQLALKRAFDIVFSLFVLALTLPIYPILMACIWIADGRPFFYSHRRETLGGRVFPCIKFRSMYKNAAEITARLIAEGKNRVDGPQVFVDPENDPRVTRIGKFMRKYNFDELPQFVNVLLGDMSVVGPRPSPFAENQYCPEWREARLSVRPGITGLWQISRTRRAGSDFQEWIKYDIEYVEKLSLLRDLGIIARTVHQIVRKGTRT